MISISDSTSRCASKEIELTLAKLTPFLFLFLAGCGRVALAQESPDQITGESKPLDTIVEPGRQKGECADSGDNVDYVRLELAIETPAVQEWTIEILANDAGWSRTVSSSRLRSGYWTGHIPGRCGIVRNPGNGANVVIRSLLAPINPAEPRSFFPPDDPPDFSDPADSNDQIIRELAKGTVMLRYMKDGKERSCSGQLLSPNMIVTNNHCIADDERAATAIVYFQYRGGHLTTAPKSETPRLLLTDFVLDVSFLELEDTYSSVTYFVPWRTEKPGRGEALAIVQHPSGETVRLSSDNDCSVRTVDKDGRAEKVDFGHRCDTGNGSSGSVVISRKRDCEQIVGLHHYGFIEYSDDVENQAVHSTNIRAFLEQTTTSDDSDEVEAAEAILNAVLFESCGS